MEHKCECKRSKWGDMIVGCRDNENNFLWFRFWCKHIPGHEGEPMPVFSTDYRDALRFVYADMAEFTMEKISKEHEVQNLFIVPASMPESRAGRNLIRIMYGPDFEDDTDGDEVPTETSADFEALENE